MDVATGRAASRVAELLGRDEELARLYQLVDSIGERGGALVVRGEAGIGKSTLLAAARERALDRGVAVVSTAGALSEAQLAFAGLHQLLLPLLGRLDLLPDSQRQALETAFRIAEGDAPDLFLIGLATLGLVAERSADTPLLFVVDDAQWLVRQSCWSASERDCRAASTRPTCPSCPSPDWTRMPRTPFLTLARRRCRSISGAGSSRRRPVIHSP